ncbi:MAG: DUF6364 family protein [Bacteroidia bacterium]
MNTKLTLSIEPELIKEIKKYSHQKGISISKIVQDYFTILTQKNKQKKKSAVDELSGMIEDLDIPENFNAETEREKYLLKKHLK